jgi:glucokinase
VACKADARPTQRLPATFRDAARMVNATVSALPGGLAGLVGIVVAVPAPIDRRDGTVASDAHSSWGMEPMHRQFAAELGDCRLPVTVINDANARAIAEGRFGLARGAHSAVVLKVSSGIGSALLRRGRILDGYRGVAGELGHVGVSLDNLARPPADLGLALLSPDAACSCGDVERQHLEAYASTSAISHRLQRARGAPVDFAEVAQGWKTQGDARWAIEDAARLLGQVVSTFVALCDPAVIVVTGRFAACGDDAVVPMRQAIESMHPLRRNPPNVVVDGPQTAVEAVGDWEWIGVCGAARLAVELNTSVEMVTTPAVASVRRPAFPASPRS